MLANCIQASEINPALYGFFKKNGVISILNTEITPL
jgi:hypothetical protein